MSNFPTLSRDPEYPIKISREDSVIKSEFTAGYQVTRQRYTRVRKIFEVSYPFLDSTDAESIMDFVDTTTHGGADSFSWVNPEDSVTYTVRFEKPPEFEAILVRPDGDVKYKTSFKLLQV